MEQDRHPDSRPDATGEPPSPGSPHAARTGVPPSYPGAPSGVEPYRDPWGRGRAVRSAVAVVVALELATALVVVVDVATSGTDATAGFSPDVYGALSLTVTVALVVGFVLTVRWQNRALGNLSALGAPAARYGAVAAGFSWLVPIWSLFGPKVLMNDLWRATDPAVSAGRAVDTGAAVPRRFLVWWLSFLAYTIAGQFLGLLPWGAPALLAALVYAALATVSGWLFVGTISTLSRRQDELRRQRRISDAS